MLRFITIALATYRLSRMFYHYERGPFGVMDSARRVAGVGAAGKEEGELAELVTCPYCIGMWVGLAFSIIDTVLPEKLSRLIIWPFAFSAVSVLLYENVDPHPT